MFPREKSNEEEGKGNGEREKKGEREREREERRERGREGDWVSEGKNQGRTNPESVWNGENGPAHEQ